MEVTGTWSFFLPGVCGDLCPVTLSWQAQRFHWIAGHFCSFLDSLCKDGNLFTFPSNAQPSCSAPLFLLCFGNLWSHNEGHLAHLSGKIKQISAVTSAGLGWPSTSLILCYAKIGILYFKSWHIPLVTSTGVKQTTTLCQCLSSQAPCESNFNTYLPSLSKASVLAAGADAIYWYSQV